MSFSVLNKVLAEGYMIRGGREEPLKATVSYLVSWEDAFVFYAEVLGQTSATVPTTGAIIRTPGHAFPPSPNIYAQTAEIEPCGVNGDPITNAYKGLQPGEFWSHAKITVEYSAPSYATGGESNPLNQLDPDNPITYCEQEVESKARFDTEKAGGWKFDDDTQVPGPFARKSIESSLILTFPRVPFLPWKVVRPYVGCVNSVAMLDCAVGTLLLSGLKIKQNQTNQGLAGTSTQLVFQNQDNDWNKLRKLNGQLALIKNASDSKRPFEYKDFRNLFL